MIMLGSGKDDEDHRSFKSPDELGGVETCSVYIVVPDADAAHARAVAAGANVIPPLQDTPYGSRDFAVKDPEGHSWCVGTYDPWAAHQDKDRDGSHEPSCDMSSVRQRGSTHGRSMRPLLRACFLFCPYFPVVLPQAYRAQARLLVAQKGDAAWPSSIPRPERCIASVPEGGITGHEVIASPDGRLAYVPIYGNSGVGKPGTDGSNLVVIDIASQKVVGNVDFGHGVRPHMPIFGPKDGLLYVTTELDRAINSSTPKRSRSSARIPTGQPESHMLALSTTAAAATPRSRPRHRLGTRHSCPQDARHHSHLRRTRSASPSQ